MPAVRGKDKASDVPADGAEGVSTVLPKVQAGEPDQREKFQNGNSKCQTLRRSADQRTWSCAALFAGKEERSQSETDCLSQDDGHADGGSAKRGTTGGGTVIGNDVWTGYRR